MNVLGDTGVPAFNSANNMANIDLNLMVIFDSIMQEQSITAAAQRLSMTQPSVSNAVSRMRHVWKDPLFVKQGRGIRPTPFAEKLWQDIGAPLHSIRLATHQHQFDITSVKRTFRIAVTDWMSDLFWLPLRQVIEAEAPHINIHAVPYNVNGETLLLDADVDMVLDYFEGRSPKVQTQHLFDNHFVCAMRPDHPLASEELNLQHFTAAEHLFLSLSGGAAGSVDALLKQQQLHRRIAMTVNHCYNIPKLLQNTDLITTIPLPIILDSVNKGLLIIRKPPFTIAPGPISMSWHVRHQRDPAILWLREKVLQILNNELSPFLQKPPFF
jgi:DNA-binding transcriptional LysR family regulator